MFGILGLRQRFNYLFITLLVLQFNVVLPMRVVSTAPGLTETLFAIGATEDVIAVSRYCDYPPQAMSLPKVGGYYDINQETILRLSPDLVLFMDGNEDIRLFLKRHNLKSDSFSSRSVKDVLDAITKTGNHVGRKKEAKELVSLIKTKMISIQKKFINKKRKSVLVVVDQEVHQGKVEAVYVVGKDEYYLPLLKLFKLANSINVNIPYPRITKEILQSLRPDVILVFSEASIDEYSWLSRGGYNPEIHIISDLAMRRPGPRILKMLNILEDVLDH